MTNLGAPIHKHSQPFRAKLFEIIFEAETPTGKLFDIGLLWAIIFSVVAVVLESVESIAINHGGLLTGVEWFFTIIFTIEYALRLYSVKRPMSYAFSFLGLIDLLAIMPTYLDSFLLDGASSLMVIRALRLLRVFRVLKLGHLLNEYTMLQKSLKASLNKMVVFLLIVLTLNVITGTIMYMVEGSEHGFTSIPKSIYWAIVTMTTVGYGDIAPETVLGQMIASLVMIMGYAIIVVPTGIFSVELHKTMQSIQNSEVCPQCMREGHESDSVFCKYCGSRLNELT